MSVKAGDWLTAAACCTEQQTTATFADLPRHHQDEMVRLGFVAVTSIVYFVTLAVLTQPIPSRSLVRHSTLPIAPPVRPALLDARLDAIGAPPLRSPRPRAAAELVDARGPVREADRPSAAPPRPERRGNIIGRFFRGIFRPPPASAKAESL
jgi:hypothetical protein